MMRAPTLGVVCLGRTTFDVAVAEPWYAQVCEALAGERLNINAHPALVIEAVDADSAISTLRAGQTPDGLLIINGTFALGGLAVQLAQAFPDTPLMLWAWHEPHEQTGKLRLNSLVGVNLNASNLYKLGRRPHTLYAAHDAVAAHREIAAFARAACARGALRDARIGFIGGHAPGFDNLAVGKLALRGQLGADLTEIGLPALVARARKILADGGPTQLATDTFEDIGELSAQQVDQFNALAQATRELAAAGGHNTLTLKCWGDLAEQYGMAGCGVVSALNGGAGGPAITTGCEGDVLGALTMRAGQAITGEPAVLMDLVSTDDATRTALFWHVGCAACSMATGKQPRALFSHFAGGKGVTAGFALRPGRVTIARIGHDDRGALRMLAATGTALETPMHIRGTVSRVQLDGGADTLLREVLANGWEHHVALIYGDVLPELKLLASMIGAPLTVA
jgi:L-fucose isomerase-like protein